MGTRQSAPLPSVHPRIALLWVWSVRSKYARIAHGVIREICSYASAFRLLAYVTTDAIHFVDIDTGTWKPPVRLNRPIQVNHASRWVLLPSGEVFCCGGGSNPHSALYARWNAAYILPKAGLVQVLPTMIRQRDTHGVVAWREWVLVFGGCMRYAVDDRVLTEGEKLDWKAGQAWQSLPPMTQSRANFNPCLLQHLVYLCGFGSIEVFCPASSQYVYMRPIAWHDCCCVYADADSLVILSQRTTARYSLRERELEETVSTAAHKPMTQNSQPVFDADSLLLYRMWEGVCWVTDTRIGTTEAKNWPLRVI